MTKHIACIVTGLIFSTILSAQKVEETYDVNFKPTTSALRYYVITEKKDDLWYRVAYYFPENVIAMMGWYKDKNCNVAEGKITWFYPNKNLKSEISYRDGKEEGMALRFHENGMMSDSSVYSNGHRKGVGLGWDQEGNQVDSSNFDGNGNGAVVRWYESGTVFYAGRIISDTIRVGRWTYYHTNGKTMAAEDYLNGKVVQCSCSDETGLQIDSTLCVEKEAHFPGKEAGWRNFLQKNLNPEIPIKNRAPEGTYTVIVQFVVDKEGRISDIKPLTKNGFGMEEEVIRILRRSPKWIPALQFGRNVKAYRKQPITFMVSKN